VGLCDSVELFFEFAGFFRQVQSLILSLVLVDVERIGIEHFRLYQLFCVLVIIVKSHPDSDKDCWTIYKSIQ
jgi:hypothetical protein